MNVLSILKALVDGGMSPVAACAMAGNMQAESALVSINLQDSYERALGYNDSSYTVAVDNGSYSMERFVGDQAGYGLCQWTHKKRKSNLYAFAKASGASVGDEAMQVQFCLAEFAVDFRSLFDYLKTTTDIETATGKICKEFEKPAVNNISVRTKYAQQIYSQYGAQLVAAPIQQSGGADVPDINAGNILGEVVDGRKPESLHMAALLYKIGYDVLWLGLGPSITDYQIKKGLPRTDKGDTTTWAALLAG